MLECYNGLKIQINSVNMIIFIQGGFMKTASKIQNVIYQTKAGELTLKQDTRNEHDIWATQAQISEIFETERSVITKHIQNILKDKELDQKSVCAKMAHTADDGKTYQVQFYSLDLILAIGYRTNSKNAISFRKWATKILKNHITDGYTINRHRIKHNYDHFLKAVDDVKTLLPDGFSIDKDSVLELITLFADTWMSLDAYDKDKLSPHGFTKRKVRLTAEKLSGALQQ